MNRSTIARPTLVAIPLLTAWVAAPAPASADWPVAGVPLAAGPSAQHAPDVLSAGDGAYFMWVEDDGSPSSWAKTLVVQRLNGTADRAVGWPAGGLRFPAVIGRTANPTVPWRLVGAEFASDDAGGFYLCYRDGRFWGPGEPAWTGDLFLERRRPDGTPSPGWPAAGIPVRVSPQWKEDPALMPDGAGGIYVAWSEAAADGWYHVRVTRFGGGGAPTAGWPGDGLMLSSPAVAHEDLPTMASDGNGGVYVGMRSYGRYPAYSFRLYRRRHDGTGAPAFPDTGRALGRGQCQDLRLLPAPDGDVYAVWTQILVDRAQGWELHAVRLGSDGLPRAGWAADGIMLSSDSYGSFNVRCLPAAGGGLLIAWSRLVDYWTAAVAVQVIGLSPDGTVAPSFLGSEVRLSSQRYPQELQATSDGSGGALVEWSEVSGSGERDLFVRRARSDGAVSGGAAPSGIPLCEGARDQAQVRIASDGAGGMYAVWTDLRDDSQGDIYARRVSAPSFRIDLPPSPLGPVALSPAYPNPSSHSVSFRLTLAEPADVEARVLDLAGRAVRVLARGERRAAGESEVMWDGRDEQGRAVAAGVYVLDLRAGTSRVIRRAVRLP